jgi:predicted metal-dependent enzyme (double-stranded beta helix superfamily)
MKAAADPVPAVPRYGMPDFVRDLRAITALTGNAAEVAERVRPLAGVLALSRNWLEPRHYVCDVEQGFGLHVLHEEPDHRLLVFAAAWLPGRGPAPHNHGTWAVVAGVAGAETNVLWERLDDRSRPGHARLRKVSEQVVGPGDVLTFPPEAIHSVVNHTQEVSVSLHVYGYNINLTARAQFDVDRELEQPITLRMTPAPAGETTR